MTILSNTLHYNCVIKFFFASRDRNVVNERSPKIRRGGGKDDDLDRVVIILKMYIFYAHCV